MSKPATPKSMKSAAPTPPPEPVSVPATPPAPPSSVPMPNPPGPRGNQGGGEEIDVKNLSKDKIRQLMGQDPKFIGRLINQLDGQMHKMVEEKRKRLEQIAADQAELDKLNKTIAEHVKPNMDKLQESIKAKTELRDHLNKQLGTQTEQLKDMEKMASSLIQAARVKTGKLMRQTASQRLEEARGFSSAVPTSTLIKGGTKKPA